MDFLAALVDQPFTSVVRSARDCTLSGATLDDTDLEPIQCRTLPSNRMTSKVAGKTVRRLKQDIGLAQCITAPSAHSASATTSHMRETVRQIET